jgi:hypothetical protein
VALPFGLASPTVVPLRERLGNGSSCAEKDIYVYFGKRLEVGYPQAKLDNHLDLIDPFNLFPRRLTTWSLEHHPIREPQLFVCDAKSSQDIIRLL